MIANSDTVIIDMREKIKIIITEVFLTDRQLIIENSLDMFLEMAMPSLPRNMPVYPGWLRKTLKTLSICDTGRSEKIDRYYKKS